MRPRGGHRQRFSASLAQQEVDLQTAMSSLAPMMMTAMDGAMGLALVMARPALATWALPALTGRLAIA